MEQTKGSLGSHQMQIQQQQQQQQNQSKKKSKNKRKSSKSDTVTTRPIDEQQQHQPSEGAVVENGLTDQIKQQLHIGSNDDKNSTNLNNSNISKCSSSCNSNNNKKVNGLMTENLNKSSKACPRITTDLQNVKKLQSTPALNGHHHHLHEQEDDTTTVGMSTTNKKSKRKPNNKKNANTLEVNSNSNHLENGHCHDMTMVTTNGFQHKQEEVEEQEQQKTDDTNNTAIKANKTNATNSTSSTSSTTATTTATPNNNNATPSRAEISEHKQEKQEQPSTALETVCSTSQNTEPAKELDLSNVHIEYKEYESELQMHDIMRLIQAELSEPYSIYTYRYFIYNWPKLCFLAAHGNEYVGAIVCKLDMHMNVRRGYIAMLAVRKEYRKLKIGTTLVQKAIEAMLADKADEVVLETEMSNLPALRLYENLGFVRDKRLFRYYLNGVDALRLKLWFR